MSFGEFLTKVAIVLTALSAAMDRIWSVPLALTIGGTLLAISFVRDASIRWREAVRMFPGLGFWFAITFVLVVPTNATLKWLIGLDSWGFTYWGSVAAAGVMAIMFRTFVIACESCSRWIMWSLGFDNRRLDAAHRYLMGWPNPYQGSDEDDDPEAYDDDFGSGIVVDGEIDCCPDCGEPLTDLPHCLTCVEWEAINVTDHRPRLN